MTQEEYDRLPTRFLYLENSPELKLGDYFRSDLGKEGLDLYFEVIQCGSGIKIELKVFQVNGENNA